MTLTQYLGIVSKQTLAPQSTTWKWLTKGGPPAPPSTPTSSPSRFCNWAPHPRRLVADAVAGHHAGLANGTGERTSLEDRLALPFGLDVPALDKTWRQEIRLPERLSLPPLGRP